MIAHFIFLFFVIICFFINNLCSYISVPESVSCDNNIVYQSISENYFVIYASKYKFYLGKNGEISSTLNTNEYNNYSSYIFSSTYNSAILINNTLIINYENLERFTLYTSYNPKYYSMFFVLKTLKLVILNENTGYVDVFIYNYTSSSLDKIQSNETLNSYSEITSFKCDPMNSTVKFFCAYIIDKKVYLTTFSLYTIGSRYTFLMNDTLESNPITEFGESYGANFYNVYNRSTIKLICSINSKRKVDCYSFKITSSNYLLSTPKINNILNYCNENINDFMINYFIENDLLACCTNTTHVTCQRLTSQLTKNAEKTIKISGGSNNITPKLQNVDNNWGVVSWNSYSESKCYFHLFFSLSCRTDINNILVKTKTNLNEEVLGYELTNIIERNTNAKIYIILFELPDENILTIKYSRNANSEKDLKANTEYVLNETLNIYLENKMTSEGKEQLTIQYFLNYSIETYNVTCSLDVTVLKCNERCSDCDDISNEDTYNCLTCASGYYKSLNNEKNCITISEKQSDWFFDTETEKFYQCSDCHTYQTVKPTGINDCDENYIYYRVEDSDECWLKSSTAENYYVDDINFYFYKSNECPENCKICLHDTCQKCRDNYYLLDGYCYSSLNGYYGDNINGILLPCPQNCSTCLSESKCITCNIINEYYLSAENNYECLLLTDKKENWFFSSNDKKFYLCSNCLLYDYTNNEEYKCGDNYLYYPVIDQSDICWLSGTNHNYYFEDSENKIFNKCYETCLTCSNVGDENNHNCITCSTGYLFLSNHSCLTSKIDGYYIDYEEEIYKRCETGCLKCESLSNCNLCDYNSDYYFSLEEENKCIHIDNKPENWFLNKKENKYELCSDCLSYFETNPKDKYDCGENDIYYRVEGQDNICWINTSIHNNYIVNSINKIFNKCHSNCFSCYEVGDDNENKCSVCIINYYFYLNNCYKYCPEFTIIDSSKDYLACKFFNISNLTKSGLLTEIKEDIKYVASNESLIINENYFAQIFSLSDIDTINEIASNNLLTTIDIGDCESILREKYEISDEENLYMIKLEQLISDSCIYRTDYFIYNENGNLLDMSECKDIEIVKTILNTDNINLEVAKFLSSQGINSFDAKDDFFNEKCTRFSNENNTDVIISDRRYDYFQNISFCEENCKFVEINYTSLKVICNCEGENLESLNEEVNDLSDSNDIKSFSLSSISNNFISQISSTNLWVVKCYNLVFSKYIKTNIGFWIILFFLIIELILFFIILKVGLAPIKNYLYVNYNRFKKFIKIKNKFKEKNSDNNNNKKNNKRLKKTSTLSLNSSINIKHNNPPKKNIIIENNNIFHNYFLQLNNDADDMNYNKIKKYFNENNEKEKQSNSINIYDLNSLNSNSKKNTFVNNFTDSNKTLFTFKKINKNQNEKNTNINKSEFHKKNDRNIFHKINEKDEILNEHKKNNLKKNKKKEKKKYNEIILPDNFHSKHLHLNSDAKYLNSEFYNFKKIKKNEKNILYKFDFKKHIDKEYSLTNHELNLLKYEEALEFDKRGFCNIYWGYLKEEQILLNIFILEDFLHLRIIKIYIFFFSFTLELFLNSLFYTDSYISDLYLREGIYDILNDLPKSIISSVIGLILMFILNILSNSQKSFEKIINNDLYYKSFDLYMDKINITLKQLKIKLFFFFVINFILMIGFWYYVSSFCAVYFNTQKFVVISTIESILISMLVPFPFCLLMTILRLISLRFKCKCLYVFNNYIDNLI